ncbi:MAG: hypothetical protein KatS3mg095_0888 [Candidatus Parcubacteria bacterium]|nr:MAG: hypothetical protein KatS3mg095_0888 [Candidatus Parcubacteria bacterium]
MILQFLIIILGLSLFEVISSIDNAIINAHILKTLPDKYKKIFLTWGIFFAVFLIRGILPFIIVKIANPSLSILQVITLGLLPNSEISHYVEKSKGLLLLGGGVYLFLVF